MRLVTFPELKPLYGVNYSREHLNRLAKAERFPRPRAIGPGRVGWIDTEIDEHLEAVAAQPAPAGASALTPTTKQSTARRAAAAATTAARIAKRAAAAAPAPAPVKRKQRGRAAS